MDSQQTHFSQSSTQQAELDESKHRESDSQITLGYDSDSELHAEDTLRMEDSEDSETAELGTDKQLNGNLLVTSDTSPAKSAPTQRKKISQLIDSDSDENQGPNLDDEQQSAGTKKKVSKIIDSDSGSDGGNETSKPAQMDSNSSDSNNKTEKSTKSKTENLSNRLQSLIDSDSATPDEEPKGEQKKKKKLKTKKEREKAKSNDGPKDLLASLNLDFSDEDSRSRTGSAGGSDDSSNSSSDGEDDPKKPGKSTKKESKEKPQRMSAKTAMEQMKVIQSESQRMAREATVSVPYHRPKQRSLQEFLNRRTVFKPVLPSGADIAQGRKKVAAAIKMTPEQLAAYAKQLVEREKEALDFFKSESDDETENEVPAETPAEVPQVESVTQNSETIVTEHVEVIVAEHAETMEEIHQINGDKPDQTENQPTEETPTQTESSQMIVDTELGGDSLKVSDTEEDALDKLVNKTYENAEQIIASQQQADDNSTDHTPVAMESSSEPAAGTSKDKPLIDYDFCSEPTPSKLALKKAELLRNIPTVPMLQGSPNTVIDLDSGSLTSPASSGADILFQRLVKCTGTKSIKPSTVNILSVDNGVVGMDTISFALQSEESTPKGKEPIPGAAYTKVQQTLRQKMEQNRMEAFRKRNNLLEEAKTLDEEEDEEVLDDETGGSEMDDEMEDENEGDDIEKGNEHGLLDEEAVEEDDGKPTEDGDDVEEAEDNGDNEDDGNESSSDDSNSDEESASEAPQDGEKKKTRIITAFEDSDDDVKEGEKPDTEATAIKSTISTDLFSQEMSNKLTQSDRNNAETGENITLLWKDTDEVAVDTQQADDDLLALCSGRFESTQMPNTQNTDHPVGGTTNALFTQRDEQTVDDSELLAICSGTFTTQQNDLGCRTQVEDNEAPSDVVKKGKLVLDSSDEDNPKPTKEESRKRKKIKRKNLNISDDEENQNSESEECNEEADEDEEQEEAERFVDYDSEENEVEVVMTKKDKKKVASTFLENEAELSESEWGSADEDEKDMDRYDIELGDAENFDQNQLQQELERIHMRRVLEQDKKEVKTLQEMFFEDEENDGVGRERQFRWRNVETTFSLDYDKNPDDNADQQDGSDDENELQWRKMRHERELLLKEKKIDQDGVNLSASLLTHTVESENDSNVGNTTTSITKKKITIIRNKKNMETSAIPDSPFLISKSTVAQGHKGSFLTRDADTLNKLATLVKVNPENEGANTVVAGKGRNFVFSSLSPAVDKMGSKRSLDAETEESAQSAKKVKTANTAQSENSKPKKRLLLGQLM